MSKPKEGHQSFRFKVPYRLLETGDEGSKPLIVYLHGYKQNGGYFEKKAHSLRSLRAWHLFLNGPYPVYDEAHERHVERWGRAWYLYDGRQTQFMESLEKSAVFLDHIISKIRKQVVVNRMTMLGYSMGGYLAGYYGLSRPERIDDLVVIGGRIKTEHFNNTSLKNLQILELHGENDSSVAVDRARESYEQLEKLGAQATFTVLDEGHRLNDHYFRVTKQWMKDQGFSMTENG